MNWLIEKFLKGFIIKKMVSFVTDLLNKVPGNDRKTVTGFVIAALGLVVQELPLTSDYVQPVLDAIHSLPAEQIVGGGLLWGALGIFHKGLKWLRGIVAPVPNQPVIVEAMVKPSELKRVS